MITVVIADDHELIRDGMRKLIEAEEDIALVGEAANAEETMNLLRNNEVDVTVLDIGLPDRDGIEVLKDIKAEGIETSILVLSMHPERRYAQRALKNGASGYLTKDRASKTIVTAIRGVYRKGSFITEKVADELYRGVDAFRESPPHEILQASSESAKTRYTPTGAGYSRKQSFPPMPRSYAMRPDTTSFDVT